MFKLGNLCLLEEDQEGMPVFSASGERGGEMIDLKFRQKNKNNGSWRYWGMVNGRWENPAWTDNYEHPNQSGRFTGKKDIDGTEIFEGDRIEYFVKKVRKVGIVQWADSLAGFWIVGDLFKLQDVQHWKIMVIGNEGE
jgi:hypothetical protein